MSNVARRARNSRCVSSRVRRSSALNGSSSRSTRGRMARARASASLCRSPPESSRGAPARQVGQPEPLEELPRPLLLAAGHCEGNVLRGRHVGKESEALENETHLPFSRRQPDLSFRGEHRPPLHLDFPAVGVRKPRNAVEDRRLSGAGRAPQDGRLPSLDHEGGPKEECRELLFEVDEDHRPFFPEMKTRRSLHPTTTTSPNDRTTVTASRMFASTVLPPSTALYKARGIVCVLPGMLPATIRVAPNSPEGPRKGECRPAEDSRRGDREGDPQEDLPLADAERPRRVGILRLHAQQRGLAVLVHERQRNHD